MSQSGEYINTGTHTAPITAVQVRQIGHGPFWQPDRHYASDLPKQFAA